MTKLVFLTFFCLSCLTYQATGQNPYSSTTIREEVKNLFDTKTKNVWVVLSCGKLDNTHVADMAFGTDGHTIRGFYFLRSSGERYYIDGDENDGIFKLVETNKRGKTTGFLIGKFDGRQFVGQWLDAEKRNSLSFETTIVETFEQYHPVLCDHKLWHAYYQGKLDNIPAQVFVQKSDTSNTILARYGGSIIMDTTIYTRNNQLVVFRLSGIYNAILDPEAPEYLLLENAENYQNILLPREGVAQFECFEFANFTTRIETMRPVVSNKKFNTWLDAEFKNWHEHGHKKLELTAAESIPNDQRYKDLGYGWVEISYIDDQYISGHVFTQSSWKKGTEKKSFLFDLKSSRSLNPAEILRESMERPALIDSIVSAEKQKIFIRDEKVKQWMLNQSFDHVTLHTKGMSFQTTFSNIYGEYQVIIPYESLKSYCKNKSFLKNF